MRFTWDEIKRRKVLREHRVDFDKLKDVFDDLLLIEFEDAEHSTDDEIRFAAIGICSEYGVVYLVFTEPEENEFHFVTARKAEKWMVKMYDEKRSRQ